MAEELKPIDVSKYKITETGQVLKMTLEEKNKQRVLNGGRGSGQTYRRLFEYYENKVANLENKNAELEAQIEEISERIQAIKTNYDNSKDKTPINAMGAEYRLLCDIENFIEKLEARENA